MQYSLNCNASAAIDLRSCLHESDHCFMMKSDILAINILNETNNWNKETTYCKMTISMFSFKMPSGFCIYTMMTESQTTLRL
jgi:hypothetical protein